MLQCSLWGCEQLVVPRRRPTDAAEKRPLVAEEPLVPVDAQEDEPARDEAQQMREENAPLSLRASRGIGR